MSTQIQRRRGTTAQHASFTGAVGETTIDTDKEVVVVHDGVQVGGYPQMRENGSNSALALGSAGTPSLKFTGDTNTGIYSPGADQVAISTGGSGRLFVNADGSIDFGTTTGSATPTVKAAANPVLSFSNGTNSAYVGLVGVNNRLLNFSTNGTTLIQSDSAINLNVVGGSTFTVGTNNTERLRITSAGLVGVGTSAPSQTLHVNGSGTQYIQISSTTNDATTLLGATSSGSFLINQSTTLPTQIWTNGSPRVHISSAGLVGIGTSSPWSTFTVGSGGTANPAADASIHNASVNQYRLKLTSSAFNSDTSWLGLGFGYSDNYLKAGILAEAKDGNARANLHFCLNNSTTNANASLSDSRMVITYGGNVGIGTTSPGVKLEVNGDIFASGGDIYTGANRMLSSDSGIRPLIFGLGAVEKARIDSSGRLLVGTSTSIGNNDIILAATGNGNNLGAAAFRASASGAEINLYKSRSATVGTNTVVQSGDTIAQFDFKGADGTNYITAASVIAQVDGTPGTNDMPGRLVFSTTADGASSPTERMRITSDGKINTFQAATAFLTVRNAGSGASDSAFIVFKSATNVGDGTACMVIRQDGDLENTNNSYGALSDVKLKENIVSANSQWGDIKALKVRKYNFKEETGHQTHTQIGLIAQEVELVSPGLVGESPDRDAEGNDLGTVTKSVNYSVLYMKAVKALQEAMERIETLEAKVAALETK